MDNKEYFTKTFSALNKLHLGEAIEFMKGYLKANPSAFTDQQIQVIEDDFGRMLDYMEQGYRDAERDKIYRQLVQRMWNFTANHRMMWLCREVSFYHEAQQRSVRNMLSFEIIQKNMEDFVTETAMLSLESDETRRTKETVLYARHHDFMRLLFDRILVSYQWNSAQREFYEQLLTSPTIDSLDAQLITSAVTLSCLTQFDIMKFRLLVHLHEQSAVVQVRERAFVGWALCLQGLPLDIYPEIRVQTTELCQTYHEQLTELQQQMICCINADKDHETIQREIMPNILRNSNFRVTRNGIEEMDDDPMEDIMHPEAADEKMEQMERTMQQMLDMQKQGSDVYFGGFKQMKRFPFFYTLSNWFIPFYIQHPDLNTLSENVRSSRFIKTIIQNGVFCNSDKYSFMLALSSIISQVPEPLREAMNAGEAIDPAASIIDVHTPIYIRLTYLQDLYRFYRLHPQHQVLVYDPFVRDTPNNIFHYFILNNDVFEEVDDVNLQLFRARLYLLHQQYERALEVLRKVEKTAPDNEQLLTLSARALMRTAAYREAADYYERLLTHKPDSMKYQYNHVLALIQDGRFKEASPEIFKLSYEHPENAKVKSVLAWMLLSTGQDEQAEKEYTAIIETGKQSQEDTLNAAYCFWFRGQTKKAVTLFKQFVQHIPGKDLSEAFAKDEQLLTSHGITPLDRLFMQELVRRT